MALTWTRLHEDDGVEDLPDIKAYAEALVTSPGGAGEAHPPPLRCRLRTGGGIGGSDLGPPRLGLDGWEGCQGGSDNSPVAALWPRRMALDAFGRSCHDAGAGLADGEVP